MTLLALQETFSIWLKSESAEIAARFGERAGPGLAVYLNNYRAQLLSCLSASFPIVRAWLGDTAFEAAAARHIERVSPHAWTLDVYGIDFPDTLIALYPADPEVAELARLECDLASTFVGPDAVPLDPSALTEVDWDSAVIHFVGTFKLSSVTTNAALIWSAINAGQSPPGAARLCEPATVAIWRDGFAPRFRTLPAEEAITITLLTEGRTFGAVCAALVERLGEQQGPATAGTLLGQWLSERMIARIGS